MGAKVINEKHRKEREERELEEFIAAQREKRKAMLKTAVVVVVCLGLVVAFSLPSIGMLL